MKIWKSYTKKKWGLKTLYFEKMQLHTIVLAGCYIEKVEDRKNKWKQKLMAEISSEFFDLINLA